jgi:hypothetical protein
LSALIETRIFRYGFFFELVRWQIVTFFDGTVVVVVVVGVVVVVVDVDVDVVVEVDELVDVLVVLDVDPVVLVVDCRIDAGLLPATTTAAVNPANASMTHATTADLSFRMGKPPFPRGTPTAAGWAATTSVCRRRPPFQTPFRSGNVKEHFGCPPP